MGDPQPFLKAREDFYRFFSGLLLTPVTPALQTVFQDHEHWENLKSFFPPDVLEDFLDFRTHGATPALIQEFEDLFRVPGRWYTSPYQSVYQDTRTIGGREVGGLMHGASAHAAERIYRMFGLKIGGEFPEQPDFLGVELRFMGHLAGLWQQEIPPSRSWQALRETQIRFLRDHLICWVPRFGKAVQHNAQSTFYRGFAKALVFFLSYDESLLKRSAASDDRSEASEVF